jgi:TPR repeat protein
MKKPEDFIRRRMSFAQLQRGFASLPPAVRENGQTESLALASSVSAQSNLGVFYRDGRGGLAKDDREAARLYKLAADKGNITAQVNLGFLYEQGRGGLAKDDREAARLYKLAADQGNITAQVNLGFFYEQGRGGLPRAQRMTTAKVMENTRTLDWSRNERYFS